MKVIASVAGSLLVLACSHNTPTKSEPAPCAGNVVGTWRLSDPPPTEPAVDVGAVMNGLGDLRYTLGQDGNYAAWMVGKPNKTSRGAYRVIDPAACTVTLDPAPGQPKQITFRAGKDHDHLVDDQSKLEYLRTTEVPPPAEP